MYIYVLYINYQIKAKLKQVIEIICSKIIYFQAEVKHSITTPPVQLVHRLCPHNNVIQSFEVEQKDSLDEHLDVLTRKLAEKVYFIALSYKLYMYLHSSLRLMKYKIFFYFI